MKKRCIFSHFVGGIIPQLLLFILGVLLVYQSYAVEVAVVQDSQARLEQLVVEAIDKNDLSSVKSIVTPLQKISASLLHNWLTRAIEKKANTVALYLIAEKGADITYRGEGGNTALHQAALFGNVELLQNFIKRGGNIFEQNDAQQTPYAIAIMKKNMAIIRMLEVFENEIKDGIEDLETLVLSEGENDFERKGKKFLNTYAFGFQYRWENGDTCWNHMVKEAVKKNKVDDKKMAMYMEWLQHGFDGMDGNVDIDEKNKDGLSPLHIIVSEGRDDLLELLLRFEVNVDSKNKENETPLHIAAKISAIDIVKQLLKKKANVFARDGINEMAIEKAMWGRNFNLVKLLIEEMERQKNGAMRKEFWEELYKDAKIMVLQQDRYEVVFNNTIRILNLLRQKLPFHKRMQEKKSLDVLQKRQETKYF